MAQRIENAADGFIAAAIDQFGITQEEGEVLLRVFVKAKAVKLDPIGGVYRLTHGAFWEKAVVERALEEGSK